MLRLVVGLVVALAVVPAHADDPKQRPQPAKAAPGKDFYKILVKPKARWVLENVGSAETIVVETYDVRKVAGADVARLRWTHLADKRKADIGATDAGKPTQVAVTDKGLYLLNADNDDAVIAKRLEGKPSRSSPPKPYKATRTNGGRYLSINEHGAVCMGHEPVGPERECADTCEGWVCISATDGIVELAGTYAPAFDHFTRAR